MTEQPKYLNLKLQRQFDVVKLRDMINELIDGDNSIGISMKWLDLAEILLRADGSWEKRPELYNKYPYGFPTKKEMKLLNEIVELKNTIKKITNDQEIMKIHNELWKTIIDCLKNIDWNHEDPIIIKANIGMINMLLYKYGFQMISEVKKDD